MYISTKNCGHRVVRRLLLFALLDSTLPYLLKINLLVLFFLLLLFSLDCWVEWFDLGLLVLVTVCNNAGLKLSRFLPSFQVYHLSCHS